MRKFMRGAATVVGASLLVIVSSLGLDPAKAGSDLDRVVMPEAVSDQVFTEKHLMWHNIQPEQLLVNDQGYELRIVDVDRATNGTLIFHPDTHVTYNADPGKLYCEAVHRFRYTVEDSLGNRDTASVRIFLPGCW